MQRVYVEGEDIYDVMLNQTDFKYGSFGHNKFYVVQLLERIENANPAQKQTKKRKIKEKNVAKRKVEITFPLRARKLLPGEEKEAEESNTVAEVHLYRVVQRWGRVGDVKCFLFFFAFFVVDVFFFFFFFCSL
jgi:hypothetical protein